MDIDKTFGEMSADEQAEVITKQFFQEEESQDESAKPADDVNPGEAAEGNGEHSEGEQERQEEQQSTEEDEQAAAEKEKPQESEGVNNLYTLEEFVTQNPLQIDPERLPESARLVHKRYMEVYEREIAPRLAELEKLKQAPNENAKDTFLEDVQREVKRRLGVNELDVYDMNHVSMVNLVSREMADARAENNRLMRLVEDIQNSPEFAQVDRWSLEQINRMPKANADVILRELHSGDPIRIRAVYDAFALKYKETLQKPAAQVKKEIAPPPKVISGSDTSEKETRKWGYGDFAQASAKEQANMLVEMGLVAQAE